MSSAESGASNGKLEHYVSPEPFEPLATEKLTPAQERFYRASQWKIMWWKFRRHRVADFAFWDEFQPTET